MTKDVEATVLELIYPARFARDRKDGGYVVSFRDVPEAITQGESVAQCVEEAVGALQAAIEARIMDGLEIPVASPARRGERLVAVPVLTALKAALHMAMRAQHTTRVELARRMGVDEKDVRRMLDPRHATKAERLERALAVMGTRVGLRVA